MVLLIELFENLDVFWTRIDHHKLNSRHNSLLSLQWLREMRVILFQCRTLRAKVAFEHI